MIPQSITGRGGTAGGTPRPAETWDLNGRGRLNGRAALNQAIAVILATERYRHLIYSRDFGIELENLAGQPLPFVRAEAERRIRDALLRDDRITGADGFTFDSGKKHLSCTFSVRTIYGVEDHVSTIYL